MGMSSGDRPSVEELMIRAESMKLDSEGVRKAFEHPSAPEFADQTSRWLPNSDNVHKLLLEAIQRHMPVKGHVLDLGAGTGRLTKLILEQFPSASVIVADYSTTMRHFAAAALADYDDRVTVVDLDMFASLWPDSICGFDVVVSGFAIHHGKSTEAYRLVYRRINEVLNDGGLFINLDHVAGEDRRSSISNAQSWRDFLDLDGGIDSDKFILSSYAEDRPIPISTHRQLLRETGFEQIEVLWEDMIFALYMGIKKSTR